MCASAAADGDAASISRAAAHCGPGPEASLHLSVGVEVEVQWTVQGFLHFLCALVCCQAMPAVGRDQGAAVGSCGETAGTAAAAGAGGGVIHQLAHGAAAVLLQVRMWRLAQRAAVWRKACPELMTNAAARAAVSQAIAVQLQQQDSRSRPAMTAGASWRCARITVRCGSMTMDSNSRRALMCWQHMKTKRGVHADKQQQRICATDEAAAMDGSRWDDYTTWHLCQGLHPAPDAAVPQRAARSESLLWRGTLEEVLQESASTAGAGGADRSFRQGVPCAEQSLRCDSGILPMVDSGCGIPWRLREVV